MGSQYAGSATFPADFTIPDASDAKDPTSVNIALEALGDRTAWLRAAIPNLKMEIFTASGTWTAPASTTFAILVGVGAGGGGGGGATGNGAVYTCGGGGGGGAQECVTPIAVTPGQAYTVAIGAGGAGGAANAAGSDGGPTTFQNSGASIFAQFAGGGKGQGPSGAAGSSTDFCFALGGSPVARRSGSLTSHNYVNADPNLFLPRAPGEGGPGTSSNNPSPQHGLGAAGLGFGGNAGTHGAASSPKVGGGAGGGGGGSGIGTNAFGAGVSGGNGGNGGAANSGGAGSAGANGAAGSYGGGGGGGGSGGGGTSQGAGGTGGAGGNGYLIVLWTEKDA